jgi:RNA polymerase sigma-70 factor, ECF subfamily
MLSTLRPRSSAAQIEGRSQTVAGTWTVPKRGQGMTTIPLHRRAEDPHSGPLTGCFRRRPALDPQDAQSQLVQRAVASARDGDGDAIRFLYVRYADNVYGYVRSMLHDEHEAEDVTQQVFTKLMTVLAKYEERDVPFSAWIMRVARNAAVDHMRARRTIPTAEVRGADETDETSYDRVKCLQEALDLLPPAQREVLIMRHVVGMTPGEIASTLGKSEGSIHGLHHRGRAALQRTLVQLEAAPTTAIGQ